MEHGSLTGWFGRHLSLTDAETMALAAIETVERTVSRGTTLHRELGPARDVYVVRRGWLFSSMLLPEGSRQILSLHVVGDVAGDTVLPWEQGPFTVSAATDATVRVIDKAVLGAVFAAHPRLAMLMLALVQAERVALADRLASVGRTSARSRIAALIVDAYRRLRRGGVDVSAGFTLPLTQEEIGDATGLTAVHVNRMMRRLGEEGLVIRTGNRITVVDEHRLAEIGNHVDRLGTIDTSWMPAAADG